MFSPSHPPKLSQSLGQVRGISIRPSSIFWLLIVVIGWTIGYEMTKIQLSTDTTARPMFLVALRFGLAGLILLIWAHFKGERAALPKTGRGWLCIQAMLLFVLQYVGLYGAAQVLSAPMLAILFSTTVLMNLPLAWLLLGQRPGLPLVGAGVGGFAGLAVILWPDLSLALAGQEFDQAYLGGLCLAMLGTLGLSLGTLAQTPLKRVAGATGISTTVTTGWAMVLAAAVMVLIAWARGESFALASLPVGWWAALLGLAVLSSALPFLGYLILVERWGATTASLTMLMPPVLSLFLSAALGNAQGWEVLQFFGLALLLIGNGLVLQRPAAAKSDSASLAGSPAAAR